MVPKQNWKRIKQIFSCTEKDSWDQDPSAPNVLRVGDKLRMYYHGRQGHWASGRHGKLIRIGLAEADAEDPFTWKKYFESPLLDLGEPGSIDSHWAAYPYVLPITDTHWHMYYVGWGGSFHNIDSKIWCNTLAESNDGGITWKRSGIQLFERGRLGACDEHGAASCCIRKVGDEYWMWYTAISLAPQGWYKISIALAVSVDGGHTFKPNTAGALLSIPPQIDQLGSVCSKPFVEYNDESFRMWFSCAKDGAYRIHYAESPDGIHFRWIPEPVLDVSESGWDNEMTCYPSILHIENKTLMYYSGNGYAGIGVVELAV